MSGLQGLSGALEGVTVISALLDAERLDGRWVAAAFSQVLRIARRERGFSQEVLAFRAEMDRTYPSLMERGLRHPTLATLLRLSRALEVEPAELINRTVREIRARDAHLLGSVL